MEGVVKSGEGALGTGIATAASPPRDDEQPVVARSEATKQSSAGVTTPFLCRFCEAPLATTFADLGLSPLANSYVEPADLAKGERFFPLHAYLCERCLLVQLPEMESPEAIFSDYAYFSSYSTSWLDTGGMSTVPGADAQRWSAPVRAS